GQLDDCVACHMPKTVASDVRHAVSTDHSIPRRPGIRGRVSGDRRLVPFWGAVTARETGLAHADLAILEGRAEDRKRALELLESAERLGLADAPVLIQLGFLYDRRGDADRAEGYYRRALAEEPGLPVAAVNLGAIRAARGALEEAARLWQDAL